MNINTQVFFCELTMKKIYGTAVVSHFPVAEVRSNEVYDLLYEMIVS